MSQDFRLAFGNLSRRPGFTAAAIATLALGIGASTAIFSVAYGVALRPLPYPEPHRLIRIYEANPANSRCGVWCAGASAGVGWDCWIANRIWSAPGRVKSGFGSPSELAGSTSVSDILARGLLPAAAGGIFGVAIAVARARTFRALIFGVEPLDVTSFVSGASLLPLAALAAALGPAWRASRIDASRALRAD